MARREVTEITCDRCQKTETQSSEEINKAEGAELEATFRGQKVKFADLCKRCRAAVENYFSRILKESKDPAPAAGAEPTTPPPSPPKPEKRGLLGGLSSRSG